MHVLFPGDQKGNVQLTEVTRRQWGPLPLETHKGHSTPYRAVCHPPQFCMRRSQASCLHPQPVQGQAEPHSKVPDENMDLAQPQVAGDALEPRVIGMWVLEKHSPCPVSRNRCMLFQGSGGMQSPLPPLAWMLRAKDCIWRLYCTLDNYQWMSC